MATSANKQTPKHAAKPARVTQNAATQRAGIWQDLFASFERVISDVDEQAARNRVTALREAHPEYSPDDVVAHLIHDKCVQTGLVGATTSGAALLPGLGTLLSLTAGIAADIGATFTLQAELVIEIAFARDYRFAPNEKQIAVLAITGMNTGVNQLTETATTHLIATIIERYAATWVAHALPVVGVVASGTTNVLTTYFVGKRADAYVTLGPAKMADWTEIWRALTGIDERQLATWSAEQLRIAQRQVSQGMAVAGSALGAVGQSGSDLLGSGRSAVAGTAEHVRGTADAIWERAQAESTRATGALSDAGQYLSDGLSATVQAGQSAGAAVATKTGEITQQAGELTSAAGAAAGSLATRVSEATAQTGHSLQGSANATGQAIQKSFVEARTSLQHEARKVGKATTDQIDALGQQITHRARRSHATPAQPVLAAGDDVLTEDHGEHEQQP